MLLCKCSCTIFPQRVSKKKNPKQTNKKTVPLDSGVDLPKQWVLFKELLPRKLLPTTCTSTPTISSTAFSLGIKALLWPSQKQRFLGRGNTFLASVIYTLVWRSQWQFLSCEQVWEQDRERREGTEAVSWRCGQLMGSQDESWRQKLRQRHWRQTSPAYEDSRLWDNSSGAILSYKQRARVPVHTLPPRITTPICDLGCVFVGKLRIWSLWKQFQIFSVIKGPRAKVLPASYCSKGS